MYMYIHLFMCIFLFSLLSLKKKAKSDILGFGIPDVYILMQWDTRKLVNADLTFEFSFNN